MVLAAYTLEQAEQDISDVRGLLDRILEAHTFLDGPTPNAPDSSGVTIYSASGNLAVMNATGLAGNVPLAQSAFFPGNTVTAASLQNLGQGTYKGGDADVGAVYQTEVWGNGQGGSVGNRQTLQFSMVFGGTTMSGLTFGTTVLPDTAAFFRFWAIGRVICLSTGIAGAWQSSMFAQINQFAANIASGNDNTTTGFSCESTGSTVKDTTVDNQVSVSCAWGGTGGGPTITGQTVSFGRVR